MPFIYCCGGVVISLHHTTNVLSNTRWNCEDQSLSKCSHIMSWPLSSFKPHSLISNQFWLPLLHYLPAGAQHCRSVKLSHQLQSVQELVPLNFSLSFIHRKHLPWNHNCKTQPGPPRESPEVVQLACPQCCRRHESGFENTSLSILLSNCEPIPWRFSSLGTNTAWKCFPLWPIIK